MKFLIVNISPDSIVGDSLFDYLTRCGYHVALFNDMEKAQRNIGEFRPDVILLNASKSVAHGFQICKQLFEDQGTKDIPVVFIATPEGYRGKGGLHIIHAKRFLSSPVTKSDLLDALNGAVRESGTGQKQRGKPHVLVVEDAKTVRRFIERTLEEAGFKVTIAENGPDCIIKLRKLRPDAIILNVLLPGMDGIEICERIRKIPRMSATPIILESARDDNVTKVKAFLAGADYYLKKPFNTETLLETITSVMSGKMT